VPIVLFSFSNSISEIMFDLPACLRTVFPFLWLSVCAATIGRHLTNARNDPLSILMRRVTSSVCRLQTTSAVGAPETDAIYTTRLEMSSQNIENTVLIGLYSE
jgi:hypothetical protein